MSLHDYQESKGLSDKSFYSLIMAAMRKADYDNMEKLRSAWPEVWHELQARYNSPGGLLWGEVDDQG